MNYYNEIKKLLLNNEINRIVKDYSKNKGDLNTYFNVGRLLIQFQNNKDDDNIIKECSIKLTNEIGKGYSVTNLKYMIKFYLYFKDSEYLPPEINWSHYIELLSLDNDDEINYYIKISLKEHLSYRELHRKIKNKEYKKINNNSQIQQNSNINHSSIKYPLNKIGKITNNEIKMEIEKQLILENFKNIIKNIGNNICFVDSKYKIDNNNYIDLLLYHIEFNCYIAVNLIINQVNKEDIYQITKCTNYIDKFKKKNNQDKTIGLILRKKENIFLIEYSSDKHIFKISN